MRQYKRSTCSGQNTLFYLTTQQLVWNNLLTCLKLSNTLNSFKHAKEHFFKKLKIKEQDIFAY